MKKLLLLIFTISLFVQCKQAEKKEARSKETYLVSEELKRYAISPLDSVWSVKLVLSSTDTALIKYHITLDHQGVTFQDSLVFNVPAGEELNGQIIFPDCITKNNPIPTFQSKVTLLE